MDMKLTKKPYFKKPIICGLFSIVGVIIACHFYDLQNIEKISTDINNTVTTFSLTFIAFSITALALLNFVQNQEWFKKIAKSKYFDSFIDRFFFSTKSSIILFFSTLIIKFLTPFYCTKLCIGILSYLVFSLVFLSIWTWICLDDLISIFKES
jgi:hypothetical protein